MSILKGKHILLGITGSVAAYKSCEIVRLLRKSGADVQVIMTASAAQFVGPTTFAALSGREVYSDLFSEKPPAGEIHLNLTEWANVAVVAPATANTITKTAHGMADDLLSTTLLTADVPLIFAPAMYTNMLNNPAIEENINTLKTRGLHFAEPKTGLLASLTEGEGRMAEPEEIVSLIREVLNVPQDYKGKKVLVTAGPTREPIDPVRYISNRSSGKMGYALAQAAIDRGAEVALISGPTALVPPDGCDFVGVETAQEMYEAVKVVAPNQGFIFKAAAVADFSPANPGKEKFKKKFGIPDLEMKSTEDILAGLRSITNAFLLGFALETENAEENALKKMEEKNLDAIVLNLLGQPGVGFDGNTNEGLIYFNKKDPPVVLPFDTKEKMAHNILSEVNNKISALINKSI